MVLYIILGVIWACAMGYCCGNIARNLFGLPFWPFAILGGLNIIICAIVLLIIFIVKKSNGTFAPSEEWKNGFFKNGFGSSAQTPVRTVQRIAPSASVDSAPANPHVDPVPATNEALVFCPGCGAPVVSDSKFCGKCGFKLQ